MLFLTAEQHQEVVRRLLDLGRNHVDKIPFHAAGMEYSSLMISFLLHNLSVAETLLRISKSFGGWPSFSFLSPLPTQRGCPSFRGFRKLGTTTLHPNVCAGTVAQSRPRLP